MDIRTVTVKCPYCGHDNKISLHRGEELRPKVVLCDVEDGPGCDRYFAAEVRFVTKVKIYTLEEG